MRHIKLLLCVIVLALLVSSCKVYPPVYKRVENFQLKRIDKEGYKVYGDLVLYNPNRMSAKVTDVLINVEMNGKHVATAGQNTPTIVHGRSEFSVPLKLVIMPDMTLMEGLKNIFSVITTHEVSITMKGVVQIKSFGVKVSIPVDVTQKVDVTKLR